MSARPELCGLNFEALSQLIGGSGRARTVKKWLAAGFDPFVEAKGRLREKLLASTLPTGMSLDTSAGSSDSTLKLCFRLFDDRLIESVLIPGSDRTTLCLSTQVGCGRGCVFCRTATMGFVRNLSCAEIIAQVVASLASARLAEMTLPSNIVFMGMGEPLDNPDEVEGAIQELIDHRAFAFASRRITVSTVGGSPKVIARAASWPTQLAWSLHSAVDETRRRMVPTARYSVSELAESFRAALGPQRGLFIELTLVDGLNDSAEHLKALIELLSSFEHKPRVNLLPMNSIGSDLRGPSAERVFSFSRELIAAGFFTKIRRPRGADQSSACGQLATASRRVLRTV